MPSFIKGEKGKYQLVVSQKGWKNLIRLALTLNMLTVIVEVEWVHGRLPIGAVYLVGLSYLFGYHYFNLVVCFFCFNFIFEIDNNFLPIVFRKYQIWS